MIYDSHLDRKADFALRCALSAACKYDVLGVVMLLEHNPDQCHYEMSQVDASTFPTRRDYRIALIEMRKQLLQESLADTVNAMKALDLEVSGGQMTPTIVVRGPAALVLQSLYLPGVVHASLDAPVPVDLGSQHGSRQSA